MEGGEVYLFPRLATFTYPPMILLDIPTKSSWLTVAVYLAHDEVLQYAVLDGSFSYCAPLSSQHCSRASRIRFLHILLNCCNGTLHLER